MRAWLVLAGVALAAPAAAQAPKGCADHMHVVVESGSIRGAARPNRIDESAMEALRLAGGARFKAAAAAACRAGRLDARRMGGLRQVVLLQASGATEPLVRAPADQFGGQGLVLEYAWAESGLAPPAQPAVEAALVCWAAGNCPKPD